MIIPRKKKRLPRFKIEKIESHSVVVIRDGTNIANQQFVNAVTRELVSAGRYGVIIVVAKDLDDLRLLNEADMKIYGWQRISNEPQQDHPPVS